MRLHRLCAVLLAPLALAAGCGAGEDAPPADPPSVQSPLRGDSSAAGDVERPTAREDHALLAVDWAEDGGTGVEVFALLPAAGGFAEPVPGDSAASAQFYDRWLRPGRGYTVLRGGRSTGTVTVVENDAQGCMVLTATARAAVSERGFHGTGIATDAPVATSPSVVDEPSSAYRAMMTVLLRREVESTGQSWSPDAEVKGLVVALPGGGAALVGSAAIRRSDAEADHRARAAAFMIAERQTDGPIRPLVTWKHARGHEEGEDEQFERVFVDAADLDGDRIPEIVARTALTESWEYVIYKRGPNGWAETYRHGGGGC
ncbi:MAG TPA: hypothetical protein VGB15_21660 [Longimicrobium sp.]|jgi:hypothetical protein